MAIFKCMRVPQAYYFVGSDGEWREFIYKYSKRVKEIYLYDNITVIGALPMNVRRIRSEQTAKRMRYVRIPKAAALINYIDNQVKYLPLLRPLFIRVDIHKVIVNLYDGSLEIRSKKNLEILRAMK